MWVMKYEWYCIKDMEWVGWLKMYSIKTNNCSYLAVTQNGRLNQRNNECEWWIMKLIASKIFNESNHTKIVLIQNKQLHLPHCSRQCSIELTKQLMWVMKYEGECI